jgi:hypothetical protein
MRGLVSLAGLVLSVGLAVGCNSAPKGVQLTAGTVSGIASIEAEVVKGSALIDSTLASLDKLAAGEQIASRNQSLKARSAEYLKNWETQSASLNSETLRAAATERRALAQQNLDRVSVEMGRAKEAYLPMLDKLRDIELYLAHDLTAGGLQTVRPMIDAAKFDSIQLKGRIDTLEQALAGARGELASTAPAQPTTAPSK